MLAEKQAPASDRETHHTNGKWVFGRCMQFTAYVSVAVVFTKQIPSERCPAVKTPPTQ